MLRQKVHNSSPLSAEARRVCIVDRQLADYQGWEETARATGVEVVHLASAAAALRLARTQSVDLWVVNCDLPGLAGSELCSMLKTQYQAAAVCLVADEYAPQLEQAAHAARATLFTCKPGHRELLDTWLNSRTSAHRPEMGRPRTRAPQPI